MNTISSLIDEGKTLEQASRFQDALDVYTASFNLLIEEAATYAKEKEHNVSPDMLYSIKDKLLAHSDEYLRQNMTASTILNDMGRMCRELGEYDIALQKFIESKEYIPSHVTYEDPQKNIAELQEFFALRAQETPQEEE